MMLHNIHTDLVATGNASTTRTPPKAKVSVNVVKHHCYINMNFSSVHDILSESRLWRNFLTHITTGKGKDA